MSSYFDHHDGAVRREAITVIRHFARPRPLQRDFGQSKKGKMQKEKTCFNNLQYFFWIICFISKHVSMSIFLEISHGTQNFAMFQYVSLLQAWRHAGCAQIDWSSCRFWAQRPYGCDWCAADGGTWAEKPYRFSQGGVMKMLNDEVQMFYMMKCKFTCNMNFSMNFNMYAWKQSTCLSIWISDTLQYLGLRHPLSPVLNLKLSESKKTSSFNKLNLLLF